VTRKKNPLRPANHQVSGGLMTAGIKPGELPSGGTNSPASTPVTSNQTTAPAASHTTDGASE